LDKEDKNVNVILETMTDYGRRLVLIQAYVKDVEKGDKRILLLNGDSVPHALVRIPAKNDFRGNVASGASCEIQPLTTQDKKICEKVGPVLKEKGLFLVGIDIIGHYLIEINITSPGCLLNLDELSSYNVTQRLLDMFEEKLSRQKNSGV
jgi:glutathione synthase